jgi:hypothetical protein
MEDYSPLWSRISGSPDYTERDLHATFLSSTSQWFPLVRPLLEGRSLLRRLLFGSSDFPALAPTTFPPAIGATISATSTGSDWVHHHHYVHHLQATTLQTDDVRDRLGTSNLGAVVMAFVNPLEQHCEDYFNSYWQPPVPLLPEFWILNGIVPSDIGGEAAATAMISNIRATF